MSSCPCFHLLSYGVNLRRHPSIRRTLPLTKTPVPSNPPGGRQLPCTAAAVHGDGLADDEAIGDELADGLAGVGVGDLVHFVRVQPDLAFAAVGHAGRQALLRAEVDPDGRAMSVFMYIGVVLGGVCRVSCVCRRGRVRIGIASGRLGVCAMVLNAMT